MTEDPDHMTLETSRSRGTVGGRLQRREETLEFVIRFAKSQVWESQPLSVAETRYVVCHQIEKIVRRELGHARRARNATWKVRDIGPKRRIGFFRRWR